MSDIDFLKEEGPLLDALKMAVWKEDRVNEEIYRLQLEELYERWRTFRGENK
ncbi:unnamed protein product [marine sediment metagenome]|uniref:Uncharacterized protein n=1 Tax=marine sediment metagenome TaxID=412755 RepID=X0SQG0_9ZZZZ